MDLTGAQVLAHRAAAQGLHGDDPDAVLPLGVVDSPPKTGAAALGVRGRREDTVDARDLVRVLSLRGAPHLHRRDDLPALRRQLRPRTPRQLAAWCGAHPTPDLAHLDLVVDVLHREFPGDTATKGELSAAISPLLPEAVTPHCPTCDAHHVIENVFRLATLLAGVELEHLGAKLVFRRPTGKPDVEDPGEPVLLRDYARLVGPFAKADAEKWLGAGPQDTWPDLRPVRVDGKPLLAHEDVPPAPDPPAGLLLFPRDPYLLGPRRLVADPDVAKRVWRPVGSPGALVVHGRVVGAWRHEFRGRTVTFQLTGWSKVKGTARRAIKDQAGVLAGVWGGDVLGPDVVEW
ncbi:winged helix DNA-binding domain-containing protein [Saccharothrix sp. 6-C]|uniref:DNA glycosylase AlkZ-like family protein n=1 Tax=Saccharothrix sp. 6-C TaxID=2781735 RepID=UPI001916E469|nr:crosslink repair DNA glycosylase YcaQ family protein [Saccharothrix sp. 6-C]QQQ74497.1 winged helix DNA-binding domain-containing protein [Saccharothrix sp. 6-C]